MVDEEKEEFVGEDFVPPPAEEADSEEFVGEDFVPPPAGEESDPEIAAETDEEVIPAAPDPAEPDAGFWDKYPVDIPEPVYPLGGVLDYGSILGGTIPFQDTPSGFLLGEKDEDDVGEVSDAGTVIRFGKPTAAWSAAVASITLDPCLYDGTDTTEDNVTPVYVYPDRTTTYGMPNSTTVPTTAIVPFFREGEYYYILGRPQPCLIAMQYDTTSHKIQTKVRVGFGMFAGTDSDWVDITTAVDCTA